MRPVSGKPTKSTKPTTTQPNHLRPTSSTQAKAHPTVLKNKQPERPPRQSEKEEESADQALLQAQILAYYRNRADAFETDRRQLYDKLDAIRLKQDLVHKTEWELKKRNEEKTQLENALEQCQHYLYMEREKILAVKRECDNLRVK